MPAIIDTAQVPNETIENLHLIDFAIDALAVEFRRHRLPSQVISLTSWATGQKDPAAFSSMLVGHRAERLIQISDLLANALMCLESGAILPAAASARSALELAAMCLYVKAKCERVWDRVHGHSDLVRDQVIGDNGTIGDLLIRVRIGSDIIDNDGSEKWPRRIHINDAFKAVEKVGGEFAEIVEATYARLCDAVHPNQGAQGAMWRLPDKVSQGPHRLLLRPRESQTTSKVDIVAAVNISGLAVAEIARLLWWIASDVSFAFGLKDIALNRSLGLPIAGTLGAPCVCASGLSFRLCSHPQPQH